MGFIDDKEKMRDFKELTKDEFLKSYSYITEQEYEETFVEYIKGLSIEIAETMEDVDPDTMGFILQNKNDAKDVYVLMADSDYDNEYLINVFNPQFTESTPDWDFSYNDYLYDLLAKGYEIKWISDDMHPNVWEDICNGYEEEIVREDKGMQLYLKYCKEHDITKEKLKTDTMEYPDAMQYYVESEPPRKITRLDFLNECKEMIKHNILCYSDGNFISKPKDLYKKEWNEENQKLVIVERMISEEKQKNKDKDKER